MKRKLKAKGGGGGSTKPKGTGDDAEEGVDGENGKAKANYGITKTYSHANFKRTYNYNGKERNYEGFFESCDPDDKGCTKQGRAL